MVRVTCKNCGNYDLFGTDKKEEEKLFDEICNFFKIPVELIKYDKKGQIAIDFCCSCKPQLRGNYAYNKNVGGKKTVAINLAKRRDEKWER